MSHLFNVKLFNDIANSAYSSDIQNRCSRYFNYYKSQCKPKVKLKSKLKTYMFRLRSKFKY
jgi:hypothetical protein